APRQTPAADRSDALGVREGQARRARRGEERHRRREPDVRAEDRAVARAAGEGVMSDVRRPSKPLTNAWRWSCRHCSYRALATCQRGQIEALVDHVAYAHGEQLPIEGASPCDYDIERDDAGVPDGA